MTPAFLCIFCLFPGILAGTRAPFALAQATPDESVQPALNDLSLEQLMQVQTVTSASRFEQSSSEAPSAMSVLTSQDIHEYGWRTLADALASLPGLYVSSTSRARGPQCTGPMRYLA